MAAAADALPLLLVAYLSRHARDAQTRRRWDAAITVLDAGYTIGLTTWLGQTPGQMLVGIRVVDAKSWRQPPWARSVIRWAVAGLPYPWVTLVPLLRSNPPAEADHPRDDEVRFLAFAGRHRAVLTKVLGAADLLLALGDPARRGIGDRAAGTVVIEARRRHWAR